MEPLLEVQNLTLGYKKPLVRNLSFSLMPGEILGVLGRNGCGKTTLLRGIFGSVRRFSGEVRILGENCEGLSEKKRAQRMALLPQRTRILEGITAGEVLAMGYYPYQTAFLTRRNEEHIRKAAAVFGVDAYLDVDCAALSRGQQQLVLLAELLVQDTPVLLLDEPDTALDYDNTYTMFRTMRELVRENQKGALFVLHDPERALCWCDRLLLLKDGEQVDLLNLRDADVCAAESALKKVYPKIHVWADPYFGKFRCETEKKKNEER